MKVTNDIIYVGVNDHQVDLFEGQYLVPNGMAYNSYLILDEKCAVMDTVDRNFTHEWLDNLEKALAGRKPDYLIVHHMEPDHAANIHHFMKTYPQATVVSSAKAFVRKDFWAIPKWFYLRKKVKEFLTNYFFAYELCINFSQLFYTTLNYKIYPDNSC